MKKCIVCGKQTEGSVGAAGYRWSSICQPCKNVEDNIALLKLKNMARLLDAVSGGKSYGY